MFGSSSVEEIVYSNGSYSPTPLTLASGFSSVPGLAVDAIGNVFLIDQYSSAVQEIVYSNGSYGTTPVTVSSVFSYPQYLAIDAQGRVYVGDILNLRTLTP
jgi:hypothetical protein